MNIPPLWEPLVISAVRDALTLNEREHAAAPDEQRAAHEEHAVQLSQLLAYLEAEGPKSALAGAAAANAGLRESDGRWAELTDQEIQRMRASSAMSRAMLGFFGAMAVLGLLGVSAGIVIAVVRGGLDGEMLYSAGGVLALVGGLMARRPLREWLRDRALLLQRRKWVIRTTLLAREFDTGRSCRVWYRLHDLGRFKFVVPTFEQMQIEWAVGNQPLPCAVEAHLTMPPNLGDAQILDLFALDAAGVPTPFVRDDI